MKKNRCAFAGGIVLALLLFSGIVKAQVVSDLKFNEILIENDSLNVDEFGEHSPWVEIFNSGYNTVDIGGCYITDDLNNPTKYWIPTGDPVTKIPARCYIIFWADGKPSRGIKHLSFKLEGGKTIALFDASGRVLLDQLEIPTEHHSNMSYGYMEKGTGALGEKAHGVWEYLDKITPASHNDHTRHSSSGEQFVKHDPSGFGMAMVAMSVVFTSLALLYFIFKNIGSFFLRSSSKKTKKARAGGAEAVVEDDDADGISGEVSAAIAMALHLYQTEIHDEENMVLTIKRISRAYSPWSSKIYTLRKYPQ